MDRGREGITLGQEGIVARTERQERGSAEELSWLGEDISPARRALDRVVSGALDASVSWLARHWLLLVNLAVGVFAFLPFVTPYLVSVDRADLARLIYLAYSTTCHQMPERSWFLFGYPMAYCERNTAIYLAVFLAGLAFARTGEDVRPLSLRAYLALIAPMALDGFTQLLGWRESTWALRTLTGGLFGAASVWFLYPHLRRRVSSLVGASGQR